MKERERERKLNRNLKMLLRNCLRLANTQKQKKIVNFHFTMSTTRKQHEKNSCERGERKENIKKMKIIFFLCSNTDPNLAKFNEMRATKEKSMSMAKEGK